MTTLCAFYAPAMSSLAKRSGILSYQLNHVLSRYNESIFFDYNVGGLRGNAPLISLGGKSEYREMISMIN